MIASEREAARSARKRDGREAGKSASWQREKLERNLAQAASWGDAIMRLAVKSKIALGVAALAVVMLTTALPALAQDVPGIEICTRESRLDRRVSCLQSNVEFLQQLLARSTRETQQKLNSATREIATLKELLAVATANMTELREQLAGMQAKIDQLQRDGQPGPPPNRKANADPKP
jgi:septal ring factor EnvC (AmiA/AmiB activator)